MLTFLNLIKNKKEDFKIWLKPKKLKKCNALHYWWKLVMTTVGLWTRLSSINSSKKIRMSLQSWDLRCPQKLKQNKQENLEWYNLNSQEHKIKLWSFMERIHHSYKMLKILMKHLKALPSIHSSLKLKSLRPSKISEWSATRCCKKTYLIFTWKRG